MGIQGMTNWKFTAFLTIALMLVAGMVSTAIAAPDDGAGTITVQWAPDNDTDVTTRTTETLTNAADAKTTAVPLPSGSKGNAVLFTYEVPVGTDMSSGAFRLVIPRGWMVSKKLVTITDGTIIYETDAAAAVDTALNGTQTGNDDATTRKRVTILPSSGDTIASVEVALDGDWSGAAAATLTIRFDNVTAAIPTQLPFTTTDAAAARRYQEYQFTASSRETGGTLRRLRGDETDVNPQPFVRVGNAAPGTGDVVITPADSYEGETGRDYRITYTAAGPMYNSRIKITIPDVLIPDDAPDGPTDTDTATGSAEDGADFIRMRTTVTQRGGVKFGQVATDNRNIFSTAGDDGNGEIVIFIDSMVKGGQVRVFYENITVQPMVAPFATEMFAIETDTNEDATSNFESDPFADPKPARVVANDKGKVHAVVGSGKVVINPDVTQINARPRSYSITYTPATKLGDAWLVVQLPAVVALAAGSNVTGSAFVDRDGAGVSNFTEARVDSDGRVNPAYVPAATDQTLAADGTFVSWKVGPRAKGSAFTKTINQLEAAATSGVYPWNIWLLTEAPATDTSTAPTLAAAQIANSLYILQAGSDPLLPDVDFAVTSALPTGGYRAASTPDEIEFTFTAVSTPIKDGSVSFSLPSGWTPATTTADKPGQVTVQTDTNAADADPAPANLDIKHVTVGTRITVKLETLPKGGRVIVTYKKGMLQRNAGEAEIRSWFKAGASLPERVSNVEELTIENVEDGAGMATITPDSVEAGSDDNTLHVMFKTPGSMNTGRVRLTSAEDWGDFQDTNTSGKNYVTVRGSSSKIVSDTTIANDLVTAHLSEFGYGDTVTFTIKNVVAQRWLGIANFKIESAGSRNGSLENVKGEKIDKRTEKKPIDLIGKVYQTGVADSDITPEDDESTDGLLRVAVTGGGDGSGTVDVAIIASKAGPDQYEVTADDGTVSTEITEQVHAGDDETHLRFTYKPVETITDGELQFTVAPGWSPPQVSSVTTAGYTSVSSDGLIGSVTVSGDSLTVPIFRLEREESIVINYGTSGGGAVAPAVSGPSAFDIKIKGVLTGSLVSVSKAPTVMVRPQASGAGTAVIDTDGDVYAGDTERTFTITYTSGGQITGGKLKVTVPDGDDWADAMASTVDVSAGSATYGGDLSATALADNADVGSENDIVISSINMAADETLTVTYMSDAPPKAGAVTFTVWFESGRGPGPETFEDADKIADLSVTVMEARAGSGMVAIAPMPEIVADSDGNNITITYTVAGQIKGTVPGQTTMDRLFKVRVPTGWSPPSAAATAAANMGTYTVEHSRMNTTTNMYAKRTGDVEERPPAKADGATTTDPTAYMVARVAPEKTVEKGDKIAFIYENAKAPAMPEKSVFEFFFDDVQVTEGGPLNVIVQSAEGASMLSVESEETFMKEAGPLTVTVKLVDDDGEPATRSEDTVVTLSDGGAGGSFGESPLTIEAAGYHAETTYTNDAVSNVTITASTTATGIAEDTQAVFVNTNNPMVTDGSVDFMPKAVKDGDTVTVTAEGTPLQTATFTIENTVAGGPHITTGGGSDMEGDGANYTGTQPIAEGTNEGTYTVTVNIGGDSESAADMLTVDNTVPEITDAALGDDAPVMMGDSVTISATLSEAATVTADVSGLNAAASPLTLTDADGDGDGMVYTGTVEVTAEGDGADLAIDITATDAAGNMGTASITMVMLDNTAPVISDASRGDDMYVMAGDMVTISATLSEAADVEADVEGLNAAAPMLTLTDADGDGDGMMYSGMVEVTADGDGAVTIEITATDAAGNEAEGVPVMVTLDNTAPVISDASRGDDMYVMAGDMVTISATLSEAADVTADVSGLNAAAPMLTLMDADGDGAGMMYSGMVEVTADTDGEVTITIDASDAAGNAAQAVPVMVTLDNTVPEVTEASVTPSLTRNGETVTISATVSEAADVQADVSKLDTTQEMVTLMDADGDGPEMVYTYSLTISEDNAADNGTYAVTVTATDAAGNGAEAVDAMVTLQNTLFYTSTLEGGTVTLFHLPLDVEGLDTVGDLKAELGGDANVSLLAGIFNGNWDFAGDDVEITADLGLLINVREETTVTFEGRPWDEGISTINLTNGQNLVGLPLDAADIDTVSDILGLDDAITAIAVLSEGAVQLVAAAGDPGDVDVAGDAAYRVIASADVSIEVMGDGWSNAVDAGAAPIALGGYKVDNQTPAVAVYGSVVDEVTGLAKEGFRVKVKNLSTKAALSEITSVETADGYDMIFVDLTDAHAARVGDVLEISADSPDPLIGIKPVRHIVTVDDVKNSRIQLEDLIAYEIPAETELLRNYPNPFNPETWIPYHLSEDADVSLTIYDVNGALVRDIDVGHQTAAKYDTRSKAIYWDGRNQFGEQVASGIYFYSLSAGDFSATRKMVILK